MDKKYSDSHARLALARQIATEAMVLLKNQEGILPLDTGRTVALLGQTQLDAIIGGGGSGASFSKNTLQIPQELKKAGLRLEPAMESFYGNLAEKRAQEAASQDKEQQGMDFKGLVASGLIYELFGRYTPAGEEALPDEETWADSAKNTDTALFVLGRRTGGEECDRRVEDDYYLTASERQLVDLACNHYANVIAVLNVNGLVDMAWTQRPEIKAVLFMGTSGEQAAGALADLLTGKASPSGKLAQTAALGYEDYPTAGNITYSKDAPAGPLTYESYGLDAAENGSRGFAASPAVVYEEDIYVGYRYFDSFEKPVLYPFGFGMSYAAFSWRVQEATLAEGQLSVQVQVSNDSQSYAGKEALQLYVHAPFGQLKKPWQELKAIGKTPLLQPGESCTLTLSAPLTDMASFDEEGMRYILEAGEYAVLIGNSSRNALPAARLLLPETIVTRTVTADIGILAANRDKVRLLEPEHELPLSLPEGLPCLTVTPGDIAADWPCREGYKEGEEAAPSTLEDVREGKASMEAFLNQMTVKELAVLCNGYGSGLPFSGAGHTGIPLTIQDDTGEDIACKTNPFAPMGYCSPAIEKYGILSAYYKDGPAGVGITAWPTGMMVASTFNPELAYEFGSACGWEAESLHVDSWLAPGMNLIRNPVEGRAFEYFSEDPCLCGLMGRQIVRGAGENNKVTACPKHFALNEQETYRRGSTKKNIDAVDTIVSARAARELYLKPFEMAICGGRPGTIMTAFNKVNGTFAAGHHALCTEILRDEWGYRGVVITDWGDLDIVVDGADAVEAGNDVIMPGGPPVIAQVLKGYEEGRVSLTALRKAAAHLMSFLLESSPYRE